MAKKFDVCCVGHMCTDILVKPVDRLPDKGKLALVDSVYLKTGGCAMNTSIGLAKLGIDVAILGIVGKDGFGDYMKNTLTTEGVDTQGLLMKDGGMTSASVVAISGDGERTIIHCLGTNESLCFDDINLEIAMNSKILFIGGTFLLPGFDGRDAARLLEFARNKQVTTVMDTAWDSTNQWLKTIEPCMQYLDWFVPSIEEAQQMIGTRNPEKLAAAFKLMGVKNVAIKMGKEGCYVDSESEPPFILPVFDVDVVDTSGAGDAWCAGFIAGLVKDLGIKQAACLGNGVGSLCVMDFGTTSGLKNYEQTIEFIKINN